MAHECELCGQECYCDCDDCGGLPQPDDCLHFTQSGRCCGDELDDEFDDGVPPLCFGVGCKNVAGPGGGLCGTCEGRAMEPPEAEEDK